jgi:hypothetical protein
MLSSFSLFGRGQSEGTPCLMFHGPDSQNQFRATNLSGQGLARFMVANSTVWRVAQNAQQICTFQCSSITGTSTLRVRGQEIKAKQSWEGMRYGKDVETPTGTWKWRPGSGGCEELRDGRGFLLARGKLPGIFGRNICALEVFIPGDGFMLDMVLSSWISMLDWQDAEEKETEGAMEVVQALMSA